MIALLLFCCPSTLLSQDTTKTNSLSTTKIWLASQVLPGSGQVINKQYWKIPIFYAGMGSLGYMGYRANKEYRKIYDEYHQPYYSPEEKYRFEEKWTHYKMQRNICYIGASAFYIASVADALMVQTKDTHSPFTAMMFSALVPGMGQIYNQKPWKLPFVYGGLASIYYIIDFNQRGYKRFGDALKQWPNDEFGGTRPEKDLIVLRNGYRRNRDLAIIGISAFYLLNIIDAYVDAHFFSWDMSDDLAYNIEPLIQSNMAINPDAGITLGLRLNFNF
ncbi:MAG TPA: DUF5683 domain-containing protein [Perlabentimonas sp.]|nr:DUF5683 domain-containing protein [Perlabentimonas sp.]